MREEEGGNLPTAYLVQSVNYFFCVQKITHSQKATLHFAFYVLLRNIPNLSCCCSFFGPATYLQVPTYLMCPLFQVGVISSGPGTTGHCAGANQPGFSIECSVL